MEKMNIKTGNWQNIGSFFGLISRRCDQCGHCICSWNPPAYCEFCGSKNTGNNIVDNKCKCDFDTLIKDKTDTIIRCKDCKYSIEDKYSDGNIPDWICKEWESGTRADGFCHMGEKKDK